MAMQQKAYQDETLGRGKPSTEWLCFTKQNDEKPKTKKDDNRV